MDDRILNKCLDIIDNNSDMLDTSVVEFVLKCMKDIQQFNSIAGYNMLFLMTNILCEALGSWQNVIGTIVNDEGYFKWRQFDKYQHDITTGENPHTDLWNMFGDICRQYSLWGKLSKNTDPRIESDIRSITPDIDFAPQVCTHFNFNRYPALINCKPFSVFTGEYVDIRNIIKLVPDDYCFGVYVSRNDYPTASPYDTTYPHQLLYPESNKDYSQQRSDLNPMKGRVRNPGIIYLPVKDYFAKNDKLLSVDTILPKDIIESHGLPTMEI